MNKYRVTGTIITYTNGNRAKETHRIRQVVTATDGAEAMRQVKAGHDHICEADLTAEPAGSKIAGKLPDHIALDPRVNSVIRMPTPSEEQTMMTYFEENYDGAIRAIRRHPLVRSAKIKFGLIIW